MKKENKLPALERIADALERLAFTAESEAAHRFKLCTLAQHRKTEEINARRRAASEKYWQRKHAQALALASHAWGWRPKTRAQWGLALIMKAQGLIAKKKETEPVFYAVKELTTSKEGKKS